MVFSGTKIIFEVKRYSVDTKIDELGESVGEALLKIHINYSIPVLAMLEQGIDIHGIAHITGEDLLKIFLVSCHRI